MGDFAASQEEAGAARERQEHVAQQAQSREEGLARASHAESLQLKITLQEATVLHRLRVDCSLMGLANVFLLFNVDSFTRNDLMSLAALKLSAHALRRGLFLDALSQELLVYFFEALQIRPGLLRALGGSGEDIVQSRRSGEWLLVTHAYGEYLSGNAKKAAEPLDSVVKHRSIAQISSFARVEAALQSLSLVLLDGAEKREYVTAAEHSEGSRRGAFFDGLLELTNACALAVLGQPLEPAFLETLNHPLEFHAQSEEKHGAGGSQRLRDLKTRQEEALRKLQETEASVLQKLHDERLSTEERKLHARLDAEDATQTRVDELFRRLLFDRLRLLCVFRLQLVNLSAFQCTGQALKLAAIMCVPDFDEQRVSVYWLLRLHLLLVALGYGLDAVHELLDLWVPRRHRVPSLLVRSKEQVAAARGLYDGVRARLSRVGKGSQDADKAFSHFQRGGLSDGKPSTVTFLSRVRGLFDGFPKRLDLPEPAARARHHVCSEQETYRDIASKILRDAEGAGGVKVPAAEDEEAFADAICSVLQWFEREGSA